VPTTSPLPPCRPQSRRRAALASSGYKRSTPPSVNNPFPPPPLHCHCAVMLTSLSHHKPPPRSPSEPPDTAPSSAPTPGAPSTPLPVPSAAPLLHHCHSPPHGLRHRGTPALMSPPLSSTVNSVHHPIGLLSGHSTADHRPPAGWILPASHRC
jgi:hypothetical protein